MSKSLAAAVPFSAHAVVESLVLAGDISRLSPADKTAYYIQLCESVGLDPVTRPFQPLKLNGKEILYCDKGGAEQLRKVHKISIEITDRQRVEDVWIVTARATTADGRTDCSIGGVPIGTQKGEALANALMKAETKAKRRVTLSICGLGMLDESELDTIQTSRFEALPKEEPKQAAVVQIQQSKEAPIPDVLERIPASIIAKIKALQPVGEIAFAEMTVDDLELVIAQCREWKPRVSNDYARRWLTAIEATAQPRLMELLGLVSE